MIPRESLGKGLALYGSTAWIGGIIGFALAGYMLQNLGLTLTCIIGGCLGLAAIGLLIPIQGKSRLTNQPNNCST
jgi:predicted MFS family arabinose efflux permease